MHRIQRRPSIIVALSLVALPLLAPPPLGGRSASGKVSARCTRGIRSRERDRVRRQLRDVGFAGSRAVGTDTSCGEHPPATRIPSRLSSSS